MEYKKLSKLLSDMEALIEEYEIISKEMEESEEKDNILQMISVAMDCIDCDLMYGNYINDTGKKYNYYED